MTTPLRAAALALLLTLVSVETIWAAPITYRFEGLVNSTPTPAVQLGDPLSVRLTYDPAQPRFLPPGTDCPPILGGPECFNGTLSLIVAGLAYDGVVMAFNIGGNLMFWSMIHLPVGPDVPADGLPGEMLRPEDFVLVTALEWDTTALPASLPAGLTADFSLIFSSPNLPFAQALTSRVALVPEPAMIGLTAAGLAAAAARWGWSRRRRR
jgi:hypothetical protein